MVGQSLEPEKVLQQVFDVLVGLDTSASVVHKAKLEHGAWEALSYLEEKDSMTVIDLSEAVPDYYRFRGDKLDLKLVDPADHNSYGMELVVDYRLESGNIIQLLDSKTKKVKDTWVIMYLDQHYLAIDMGALRVFFTHTAVQD